MKKKDVNLVACSARDRCSVSTSKVSLLVPLHSYSLFVLYPGQARAAVMFPSVTAFFLSVLSLQLGVHLDGRLTATVTTFKLEESELYEYVNIGHNLDTCTLPLTAC